MTKPKIQGLIVVFTLGHFQSDQYGRGFVEQIRHAHPNGGVRVVRARDISSGNILAKLATDATKGDKPPFSR